MKRTEQNSLTVISADRADGLPVAVANAGAAACFAYDEFLLGSIRNKHTRKAYRHAVHQLLSWCHRNDIELVRLTPGDVGRYLDCLQLAAPTKKLHLSALRRFFDELVLRHVVVLNPCASVRTDRYQLVEGKTPEIPIDDARQLLASIETATVVGLRDKAVIGILIYTAARVGAVAKLCCGDFYHLGRQYCLRFCEKSGKSREIPVRTDLEQVILAYRGRSVLENQAVDTPMFRTARGRTGLLTEGRMTANDMGRMVKRRLGDVGLSPKFSAHSFRVMAVTDLLEQGVALEDVQHLAGHCDPRTTRLYDRRSRRITRNIVERISV